MMPPSIEMVGMELYINCHRAESLPKMDVGGKSDPYLAVEVAGCKRLRTKRKNDTLAPKWDEQLTVPIRKPKYGPATSNRIRVGCWDYDAGHDLRCSILQGASLTWTFAPEYPMIRAH